MSQKRNINIEANDKTDDESEQVWEEISRIETRLIKQNNNNAELMRRLMENQITVMEEKLQEKIKELENAQTETKRKLEEKITKLIIENENQKNNIDKLENKIKSLQKEAERDDFELSTEEQLNKSMEDKITHLIKSSRERAEKRKARKEIQEEPERERVAGNTELSNEDTQNLENIEKEIIEVPKEAETIEENYQQKTQHAIPQKSTKLTNTYSNEKREITKPEALTDMQIRNEKEKRRKNRFNITIRGDYPANWEEEHQCKKDLERMLKIRLEIYDFWVLRGKIIITIQTLDNKIEIMRNKRMLRNTNIWIDDDDTPYQIAVQKWIRYEVKKIEEENNIKIKRKYMGYILNKQEWRWDHTTGEMAIWPFREEDTRKERD